jgi:hypothetical protein
MELLVKPKILTSYTGCPRKKGPTFGRVFLRSDYTDITQNTYIQSSMVQYGPTFGNAEIRLFLFAAQCFNTESMQEGYPNYRWDLIQYVKG